jgi:hypothetical protein
LDFFGTPAQCMAPAIFSAHFQTIRQIVEINHFAAGDH